MAVKKFHAETFWHFKKKKIKVLPDSKKNSKKNSPLKTPRKTSQT